MIDVDHLKSWVGRSETHHERLHGFPSNAMAATLNRDDAPYIDGSELPHLWHWLHFLPIFKMSDAGYDGHAALGGFLPPVPLPRRMWAGSRFTFHRPLHIGDTARKTSTVRSVDHKSGRSGDLVFVTVEHQLTNAQGICIDEEHDIVYRDVPDPNAPAPTHKPAPSDSGFSRFLEPDSVLLFRYSALTFNGHRIHYDHPFCTGTEGYGGLVVHGPLLATLMMDLLRRQRPDDWVQTFEFRAIAPIFDTNTFTVHGKQTDDTGFDLWIARDDGALAMQGRATLGPKQ